MKAGWWDAPLMLQDLAVSNLLKKDTLPQMFSGEVCEISENTFCYRTISGAASEMDSVKCLIYNRESRK